MTAPLRRQFAWLRRGLASLALFALIGAGHFLPALHFALVVHRVCAEHGELVHELASAPEAARERGGPELRALAAGHEHEHCGVPALPSSGVATAPAASVRGEPLAWLASVAGSERGAYVRIALLAYAPKLAPPLAA